AAYETLAETTEALAEGMRDAARGNGVAVQVQSLPGLVTIFFTERPVTNYAGAAACDTDAFARWCRGLLDRGVYPPPSQFEAWFPSLAHGREHVMRTITAGAEAFSEVGGGGS